MWAPCGANLGWPTATSNRRGAGPIGVSTIGSQATHVAPPTGTQPPRHVAASQATSRLTSGMRKYETDGEPWGPTGSATNSSRRRHAVVRSGRVGFYTKKRKRYLIRQPFRPRARCRAGLTAPTFRSSSERDAQFGALGRVAFEEGVVVANPCSARPCSSTPNESRNRRYAASREWWCDELARALALRGNAEPHHTTCYAARRRAATWCSLAWTRRRIRCLRSPYSWRSRPDRGDRGDQS